MICNTCNLDLDVSEFSQSATARNGYYNSCKKCRKVVYLPSNRRNSGSGYVYLFEAKNGRMKIGYTSMSPDARLKTCLSNSPIDVVVSGAIQSNNAGGLETELHKKYAEYHWRNEWYDFPPGIKDEIRTYFKQNVISKE